MLQFNFLPKFSVIIVLTFILFTIIGTVSHEFGHIAVAKYFDYDVTLDYGSMSYFPKGYLEDKDLKKINRLIEGYDYTNYDSLPENLKSRIDALDDKLQEKYPPINENHVLAITIGGPLQTIITSLVGLFILIYRRKLHRNEFKFLDWLAVILSLFILRLVFNFVTGMYSTIVNSESYFIGDEYKISRLLGYNEWVVPNIALVFGLIISLFVIFKIIPIKYRFSFLVSGFVGGILGYIIWFGFLGAVMFNSNICF